MEPSMQLTKTILITVGLVVMLSSCSVSDKSERESMSEIYSDVMAYEFSLGSRGHIDYCKAGDLVISSLTVTEVFPFHRSDWARAKRVFPRLERGTWENFVQVSSEQVPFPADLDLGCMYTLLDVKQNPPNRSREDCIGIEYFSQIGFNSRKNQALVYREATSTCGDFGFSNLYFAELIDGHWIVTEIDEGYIT
jgi:hypothetical protein